MEYYHLSNSTGKETGMIYPQLHCVTQPHAHALSHWRFPDFKPKLSFELGKTAKLTDVLSNAATPGNGFLINQKVRDILTQFYLMEHKFYEATIVVLKTGETLNYFWLHLSQPSLTYQLDYGKSKFSETKYAFRENEIEINSFEHYKELKAKDTQAKFGVVLDEIYVTKEFDKRLDVFTFLPFSEHLNISSRLKLALEKNGVTGFEYEEAPEVVI